ncbi:hypothetical protein [Bacteroides caecimuris]|uniref:hypothetical protein n=1 Tax=Bacteroides caecimuris TaxID=1796613 RepID=UPI0026E51D17|nr:hypothetical protein [Bacteroides caecimuris]
MNFSDDFKSLLIKTSEGYIGHGNPNAKILFLGQEPAWNKDIPRQREQYLREIATNRIEWEEIVARGDGYEMIDSYADNPDNVPIFYSPLHPWPLQKFQIRRGSEEDGNLVGRDGTATTWYYYQVLVNLIFSKSLAKDAMLTFHRSTFHTDMSDAAYRQHDFTKNDSKASVIKRIELLMQPFYNSFPVVIAAVGNFPRDTYGDGYFGEVFGVKHIGNQAGENLPWINVSVREDDKPQLLIHCQQVSAPLPNAYFKRIAEIVRDFANKNNVDLNPSR